MVIYRRTNAGSLVAQDADSELPRKLRTLLISIDGKTTVQTYVNSLSSFGDVEALLDSLKASGLIEATAGNLPDQVNRKMQPFTQDTYSSVASSQLVQPFRNTAFLTADTFAAYETAQNINSGRQQPQAAASLDGGSSSTGQTKPNSLPQIISSMSDFVTLHFPEQSLEIILSLESLQSLADVQTNMPSYAEFIQPVGQAAREHLAVLNVALNL